MENRYLLGIDAGSTKTHYLLLDRQSPRMDLHTGGAANHETLDGGFAALEMLLGKELGVLLSRNGITPRDIAAAGLGVSGVDTQRQHDIIAEILRRMGFSRFRLANDAALGIKAECLSGSGVCAINGSGFSVFAMDREENALQIGGMGYLTGDKGGGSYYVDQAMAAVHAAIYTQGAPTRMTERTFALLGISGPADFLEALSDGLYGGGDATPLRRDLSRMLHQSAQAGDAVARAILAESATTYGQAIISAIRALPALSAEPSIRVVLAGSGFVRCECDLAEQTIVSMLDAEFSPEKCEVIRIGSDPVLGAILWAHSIAGLPVDEDIAAQCRALLQTRKH